MASTRLVSVAPGYSKTIDGFGFSVCIPVSTHWSIHVIFISEVAVLRFVYALSYEWQIAQLQPPKSNMNSVAIRMCNGLLKTLLKRCGIWKDVLCQKCNDVVQAELRIWWTNSFQFAFQFISACITLWCTWNEKEKGPENVRNECWRVDFTKQPSTPVA